ncbi:hypothetical protein PJN38_24270 [Mycobacterium kansasii]
MPNQAFIDIVTQALATHLTHPGDDRTGPIVLPLPMFRTASLPADMAQHFADEAGLPHPDIARLTAEALDHMLDTSGKTVIDTAELTRLRNLEVTTEPRRNRTPHIHCHCGAPLIRCNITDLDTDKPKVYGGKFITAIQQLGADCVTGHQPAN